MCHCFGNTDVNSHANKSPLNGNERERDSSEERVMYKERERDRGIEKVSNGERHEEGRRGGVGGRGGQVAVT